ncbi:hypothetical protein TRL7639_02656 [Falsiruegeria litorea R37]|uniref:DUF2244 domain-containing protein n=1 Tax=Falsiruegeria litorea R37 TaxID=1200284 RepID=A0A1Y5SUN9_9RHOB|nr:hypothetical protein [Falsiruegeria litorea]SLN48242.1 hypothetical protein TRL7639_02656 [Falsiruegeria litorea R37]
MNEDVLAVVEASAPRRWMGVIMLAVVSLMSFYVALLGGPEPLWQAFLIVVGGAAMWLAMRMWRATAGRVELTETELRSSDGQVIARVEDIESLDRGVFAFKPSNGFLLRTSQPASRVWQPGLWWRMGRRIGIGGVTPGSQSKFMAEMISAMIAQRG